MKQKQKDVNNMCNPAKIEHYNAKINEHGNNSKALFQFANTLLHKDKNKKLPTHTCKEHLENQFTSYFSDKIAKIHSEKCALAFPESQFNKVIAADINPLTEFKEVTDVDLQKLIETGNSKSCCLDSIPTVLLKELLP